MRIGLSISHFFCLSYQAEIRKAAKLLSSVTWLNCCFYFTSSSLRTVRGCVCFGGLECKHSCFMFVLIMLVPHLISINSVKLHRLRFLFIVTENRALCGFFHQVAIIFVLQLITGFMHNSKASGEWIFSDGQEHQTKYLVSWRLLWCLWQTHGHTQTFLKY